MTKKDFELLARTINGLRANNSAWLAEEQLKAIAHAFAKELMMTNDRFNESRFIAACLKES